MIEIKNLAKYFGLQKVVDNISFEVEKGDVLGFLGPNAAGKSTTMRMITGFLAPSSGTAVIGGSDIVENCLEAQQKIGYLPENAPVYPEMTVKGYIDFCAQIRGFEGIEKNKIVDKILEQCFLSDVTHQTVSTLSKGFKQRVCFAQCILHDPEYLILDEPTDGLDPNQKHEVRTMIKEMAANKNKAIILSTHILEEVDAVCTRAIIISKGRIVADDSPQRLRAKSAHHGAVLLKLQDADMTQTQWDLDQIKGVKSVELIENKNNKLTIRVYPENVSVPLADKTMQWLVNKGYSVESMVTEQGRLDEVFRMITVDGELRTRLKNIIPVK